MGIVATDQLAQSRMVTARLDILRQELLAPIMSIEGYTELLKEGLGDDDLLQDLERIIDASIQTRSLVYEMLEAETEEREEPLRDTQRSKYKHDLRNSVGAISGYSEMILEELEELESLPVEDESKVYLNHLIEDAEKLLQMIETMFESADFFGEDAEETLNVDIHSIFDSFERSDLEISEKIFGRILVVDDNESSRNILSHKLKSQGHTVRMGSSGREALELISQEIPDILLLDLFMYDMNGFEVLKEMNKDEALRAIPVIVITGLSDKNAAIKCIEAGAFDILIKPVNPALLQARVTACLEKKAWRDKEQAYQRDLEKSHAFIRKVFGRYMSDEVVEEILNADDGMQLGGAKKLVTIMMTDIRGFSMLSQELDAQDCVTMLNNYFGTMTPLIQKYDGVINEFLGDAILAIFGAPVHNEQHARQAMACAIEMQNGMAEVNQKNHDLGLPSIEMGIALNTGEVVVGNIGSERRSKYGVVGHHVNLTARIESFTVGNQIMVSEYTIDHLGVEVDIAQTLKVDAKGIKQPVQIFEVVGIGAPFNLSKIAEEQVFIALNKEIEVAMSTLSGKAVADTTHKGFIIELSENSARLACTASLELLNNLRMTIPAFPPSEEDQVFAKVTAVIEDGIKDDRNHYHIKLTSASKGVRDFFQQQTPSGVEKQGRGEK